MSEIYKPDAIASQAELDAYIRRIAWEANQVYEELTFSTALMPLHEGGEVLLLRHPEATGVYCEIGWTMDLESRKMTHMARRLVAL